MIPGIAAYPADTDEKIQSFAFTAEWHACPQSDLAASAVIFPGALSWLKCLPRVDD